MTNLRIHVRDITPDQHGALMIHLRDSRIRQDQITVEDADKPSGPLLWIALLLLAATIGMILAWIWGGDWRWGATAIIPALTSLITFGLSISKGTS